MKILVISHQRCGSTTLCKWLSKELNIELDANHYDSKTFKSIFFNDNIIKKNEVEDYYPTKEDINKFNKVIYLTRYDSINAAISCVMAKNTNNWHDEYKITKEWIDKNQTQILEESSKYNRMKSKIKDYSGFQTTYEGVYVDKSDVNKILKYMNIDSPKYLDMLNYDKKYRKDCNSFIKKYSGII